MKIWKPIKRRLVVATLLSLIIGIPAAFSLAPLQSWTLTSSTGNWKAVACNNTCVIQYAAIYSGGIYKSTDGGGSWVQLNSAGNQNWNSLAASADGSYVTAVNYGGYIYRSADGGSTWGQVGISANWRATAMNQSGEIQLSAAVGGNLYVSSDYGQTWSSQSSVGTATWGAVDLNAAGTLAIAVGKPGNIWVGVNSSGTWTWSNKTGSGQTAFNGTDTVALNLKGWSGVVLSETGTRVVAVNDSGNNSGQGNIFFSSDTGTSWTELATGNFGWQAIAGSSDLLTIVTASSNACGSACRMHYREASTFGSWNNTQVGAYSATAYQIAVAKDASRGIAPIYGGQLQYAGTVISSGSVALAVSNAIYRKNVTITANVSPSTGGRTTFYANGKRIPGCISKLTSGSSVSCTFLPSRRGALTISARYLPTDSNYQAINSLTATILVSNRTDLR